VSGAAKEEVDTIIDQIFGKDTFNIIINGDQFEGKGKPDPATFKVALQSLNLKPYSSPCFHHYSAVFFYFPDRN
jgi:beta-phosphoglucomutase-like phosphatase (HAD superfamily)